MIKTSFGEMKVLLQQQGKPQVEFLRFLSEGRPHKHLKFESFFVLSGEGKIYFGNDITRVQSGSIVTIPPKTLHWMKPDESSTLEGLLWYHDRPLII